MASLRTPSGSPKLANDDSPARVDYAPLERNICARMGYPLVALDWPAGLPEALTTGKIADWLGVPYASIARWRRTGTLSIYEADEAAILMKTHPYVVWGDQWFVGAEDTAEQPELALSGVA